MPLRAQTVLIVSVACLWLLGLYVGSHLAPPLTSAWRGTLSLGSLGAGLMVWRMAQRPGLIHSLLLAVSLLPAAFTAGLALRPGSSQPLPPTGLASLDVEVRSVRHGPGGQGSNQVRVLRGRRLIDGMPIGPGTLLSLRPRALPEGARLRILANLRPLTSFRNPSPHPERQSALQGTGRLAPARPKMLSAFWPAQVLGSARARVRAALERSLDPRLSGLARALTLGDAAAVDQETREAIRSAGLAHVLAVSGLHVTIVVGLWVGLLGWLLLRTPLARRLEARRLACGLGVPSAVLYASFAGGSPSAWRAALTAGLSWAVIGAGRRPRAVPVTACAVLLLSAARPTDVQRPGLWLSVIATAALLSTPSSPHRGLRGWLTRAYAASWRTSLATAPVVIWCFGDVPVAGLVANIIVLPWASGVLVPAANLHALLATFDGSLLGAASLLSAWLFEQAARVFMASAEIFAHVSPGPTPPLTQAQACVLAVSVALLLALERWRARATVLGAAVLCLGACEMHLRHVEQPQGRLRVLFADVGQGDGAVIDLPDGRLLLMDVGNPALASHKHPLVKLLQARRRRHIDLVVLSHPHPDHYGGLPALIAHFPVRELWDTGQAQAEEPAGDLAQLLSRAAAHGAHVRKPDTLCKTHRFGEVVLEVLAPCPAFDPTMHANDNSFVIRLRYGRHRILFTGDVETEAERRLATRLPARLRADVLKVPHHGSRTSSTEPFLRAVQPRLAVVSAGQASQFGHPHEDVMARYARYGITTVNIAKHGGTLLESDGETLTLQAWDGTRWSLP